MHYYPFNIGDFNLHTSHLTLEEEAVYRRLLDFYYDTEAAIPLKTDRVIRRLRLGGYTETVKSILEEYFLKQGDGWHNLRADIEINDYHKKAEIARPNGKKGGRPKKNSGSKTERVILANPDLTQAKAKQELETVTRNNKQKTNGRFTPPSIKEVEDYCQSRSNSVNPATFVNHYQTNGWMRGRNKVKDWKACVRYWEGSTPAESSQTGVEI